MNGEILKLVREKGLLLEKEIFDLVNGLQDIKLARTLLESLERVSGQKIITKGVLTKNMEFVQGIVEKTSVENKVAVENVIVKLGLNLEIRKERIASEEKSKGVVEREAEEGRKREGFRVLNVVAAANKKLGVEDFVGHFRARYQQLQGLLMQRPELTNLVSIGKISGGRQNLSIIGIVAEKRVTKNKNIIIRLEDLTGEITGIVKFEREEVFAKAEELQLDDVVGVRASGDREVIFIHDIFWPDAFVQEKKKFSEDICIAFLSDVHAGGGKHLGKNFEKFLEWLNSEDETAKKIGYLFFLGDNVDGVGIFPGQEHLLELKSMREQYELLALYLRKVPKKITMFMCPGQHDAVRVAEPQPIIDKKYAAELYEIENLVLVSNPSTVKLVEGDKELNVLMYHGDSIHDFIHEIPELRRAKAERTPAKAVRHMLKRRHLAPVHSHAVYIPNADKDLLVIDEVPDILCTGEVHRVDVENYNGILILTGSCWQATTQFEEKVGNLPEPCKVPVLNLKTRELKIFDFSDLGEKNEN